MLELEIIVKKVLEFILTWHEVNFQLRVILMYTGQRFHLNVLSSVELHVKKN